MMESRKSSFFLLLLGLIACLGSSARAETKLTVDKGWGDHLRDDRWIPIFVTAFDDKPRNVMLDIVWPTEASHSMRIQQALTIDTAPRTFPLLVPVRGYGYYEATFTLTDRETGKTIARFPSDKDASAGFSSRNYDDPSMALVGISGVRTTLETMQAASVKMSPAFLSPMQVPDAAMGFDSLDVLVLNAPNLVPANFGPAPLNDAQQQAIVEWVRAGGRLLIWPGDGGFPESGPLVDVLPARVRALEKLELSASDLAPFGLSARWQKMGVWHLDRKPGAIEYPLLNGKTAAYSSRLGLGRIVLAPFNLTDLPVSGSDACNRLWQPILAGIECEALSKGVATDSNSNMERYGNHASAQLANFLGNVPGAARVGFNYIAILLVGMMLIVGPLDWFVLKKMGRQHWTWITTASWVTLVTTGALYAGHLFKSGNLDYKTVRTIDQVGDATIASTDYVSLYAARTRAYNIETQHDGWWQPAGISGNSRMRLDDIDFHQTRVGNTPLEMLVNVWSLRFLRGDKLGGGPPVLSANLKLELRPNEPSPRHVVGTITNLSGVALKNVRVALQSELGLFMLQAAPGAGAEQAPSAQLIDIAPNATVRVDAAMTADGGIYKQEREYYYYEDSQLPVESELWKTAARLNLRRGKQMEALLASEKSAIIYAESDKAAPAAPLVGEKAVERHFEFIRALVELH
jgi:hypothetical protein